MKVSVYVSTSHTLFPLQVFAHLILSACDALCQETLLILLYQMKPYSFREAFLIDPIYDKEGPGREKGAWRWPCEELFPLVLSALGLAFISLTRQSYNITEFMPWVLRRSSAHQPGLESTTKEHGYLGKTNRSTQKRSCRRCSRLWPVLGAEPLRKEKGIFVGHATHPNLGSKGKERHGCWGSRCPSLWSIFKGDGCPVMKGVPCAWLGFGRQPVSLVSHSAPPVTHDGPTFSTFWRMKISLSHHQNAFGLFPEVLMSLHGFIPSLSQPWPLQRQQHTFFRWLAMTGAAVHGHEIQRK